MLTSAAPIASCPPPRLASGDAGAGEARYGGVVDMADLHQFGAYTDSFGIGPIFIDCRLHEGQKRWRVLIRPAKPRGKFYNEVVI